MKSISLKPYFSKINLSLKNNELSSKHYNICSFFMPFISKRSSTKDIYAVYEPKTIINDIALKIALEKWMPKSRLNDGIKGFMNEKANEKNVS
jgi:hypothetical protein